MDEDTELELCRGGESCSLELVSENDNSATDADVLARIYALKISTWTGEIQVNQPIWPDGDIENLIIVVQPNVFELIGTLAEINIVLDQALVYSPILDVINSGVQIIEMFLSVWSERHTMLNFEIEIQSQ